MDAGRQRGGEPRLRGGVADADEVKIAAMADVYGGGSGMDFLNAADPATVAVLQAKATVAAEMARERDKRLARYLGAVLSGRRI